MPEDEIQGALRLRSEEPLRLAMNVIVRKLNVIVMQCQTVYARIVCPRRLSKRGPKAGLVGQASSIICLSIISSSKRKQRSFLPSDAKTLVYKILAAPLSFAIPEDFQAIRDYASCHFKLPPAMPTSSPPVPSSSTTPESNQGSNDAEEEECFNVVDSLTSRIEDIVVGSFRRQHAPHASQMLLRTALDIRDELNGSESRVMSTQQQRTEFWTRSPWHKVYELEDPEYVFPEDDLMQQLVSLFFSNINIFFPILNGPIFKQQVFEEKLHRSNPMFAATLLAVCSLGSRYCKDPRTLYDGSQSERSAGWKYFQQIRLARAKLIQPVCLFEIQLYALSSLFLQPTPLSDITDSLIGMGIRSAQEVGAHRKQPLGKTHQKRVEQELWKRAYWVLVALDSFQSGATGRPRATTENDYDLDFPIECDDEYWIESNNESPFMQPLGQASYVAYWNHFLQLLQIVDRTRRHILSIRRSELSGLAEPSPELEKIFLTMSTATNEWIDSIPSHLRWDPHNPNTVFFLQSVMLQAWLLFLQMRFYARWVRPGPVSSLSFSSLAICTNSARAFIHILLVYHQRPDFIMMPRMIPVAFLSAVLLLINIWKQTWMNSALDPGKDLAQVHACMNVMSSYEARYENAGRFRDVLQAIMSVSRIPLLSRQNVLKRTRDDALEDLETSPLHEGPSTLPSEPLSFGVPPAIPSPTIGPFEPHYMRLSSDDEANNLGLSNYDQEDWDSFMILVDDLLSQTNQDRIF
ncbi:hypothetical protein BT96DRAFT_1000194 [Gymnopus androsaceus JB14]|uniref:Xylanolytic transcriptional activator regulatory domain-containing protein n=1 Tax=Gymnopus androsaceus JB14 TaxID=1447944 RepID=A0A6A4H672_9AGAR|nr:hypothetical protein BT96DRAFT_1000194 [Gymnopus androsaceus JB14]